MKLFETIERLQILHQLIVDEKTGSPEELATRLHVKKAQLYNIIDELKCRKAPIGYSRRKSTFYYSSPFHMEIMCNLKLLSDSQQKVISGGAFFIPSNFIRRREHNFATVFEYNATLQALVVGNI